MRIHRLAASWGTPKNWRGVLSSSDAQHALDLGLDLVMPGRVSIANPDFPNLVTQTGHATTTLPISLRDLERLGYSKAFQEYLLLYRDFAA